MVRPERILAGLFWVAVVVCLLPGCASGRARTASPELRAEIAAVLDSREYSAGRDVISTDVWYNRAALFVYAGIMVLWTLPWVAARWRMLKRRFRNGVSSQEKCGAQDDAARSGAGGSGGAAG